MSEISHAVVYPYPPAALWRALSTQALISEWLMPATGFVPAAGQEFRLQAPPMPGWDGRIECRVLEVDDGRRMVWSWRGSNMRVATTLTFTLSAVEGGTRLTLHHAGFRGIGGFILSRMHLLGWRGKFLGRLLPALLARGDTITG